MIDQIATMPLLNLLPLLIVIVAYFLGVAMFSYKRGGARTLWTFVIGGGGLLALHLFRDEIITIFNLGIRFLGLALGGGLSAEGGTEALEGGTNLIIRCTPETLATCNESGFLFLVWIGIVVFGHLLVYLAYDCVFESLTSKPTPWAFLVGLANAWLYGFILLPPLCAMFGLELGVDAFTADLLGALRTFGATTWALIRAVFNGLWDALSLPYWVAFLIGLTLLLIIAAGSITKGKAKA